MKTFFATLLLLACVHAYSFKIKNDWFLYDLKGKVKTIVTSSYKVAMQNDKTVNGEVDSKETIAFNSAGFLTSYQNEYFGSDSSLRKRDYSYNKKGELVSVMHSSNGNSYNFRKDVFVYLEENNMRIGCLLDVNGDTISKTVSQYNKAGLEILYQWVYNNAGDWELYDYFKMDYDKTGRMVLWQNLYETDTVWFEARTEYGKGSAIETAFSPLRNIEVKEQFTYDKYGNKTSICPITDGKIEEDECATFEFVYDNKGNWIRKISIRNGEYKEIVEREITYY